jgi:hypothetical protein
MKLTTIVYVLLALVLGLYIINPLYVYRICHTIHESFILNTKSSVVQKKTTAVTNKKVALCISGQFREIQITFANHITTLLPLKADIFIVGDINLTPEEKEEVIAFYKPIYHRWTDEFVPSSPQVNTDRMFSKIYYCDQLRQEYEKQQGFTYDYVIRIRPDIILRQPFPTEILPSIKGSNMVYFPSLTLAEVPKYKNIPFSKIYLTDQMFLGTSEAMKAVCECYLHLSKYTITKHCINEYILMEHMMASNLLPGVFHLLTSMSRTFSSNKTSTRTFLSEVKNMYLCTCSMSGKTVPSVTFI